MGDSLELNKSLSSSDNLITIYADNMNRLCLMRRDKEGSEESISNHDHWVVDITDFLAMDDAVREQIGGISLRFSADLQHVTSIKLTMDNMEGNVAKTALYNYVTQEIFEKYNGGQGAVEIGNMNSYGFIQNIDIGHLNQLLDKFESDEVQTIMLNLVEQDSLSPRPQQP